MAVVTPPQITPPPAKPQRGEKATFRERVDDFITWMIAVVAQFAALATNVFNNAQDAAGSAGAANTSAGDAAGYRNTAKTHRDDSEGFKNQAQGFRNEAEGFKNAAASSAAALRGTSVNALTIGTGSKSLTTETGRQFDAGQTLKLVVVGNGEAWMSGRVTSYNSATGALVVNVLAVATAYAGQGSNTWNLYVAGEVGPTGPTGGLSGGNLTGALNERRASQVPTSASPDIWSAAGNWMYLTGDGTVTGFPTAPQSGSRRTLLVNGKITFQSGGNMIVYGGTMTLSNGDLVDVTAEDLNLFLVTVRKKDGTPVAHDRGALHNLRVFGASGIFTATKTGWHKITVIGASGSSGAAAAALGGVAGASGAGAGGFISGMRWLVAGTSYIVTVAAGAVSVFATASVTVGSIAQGNTADITRFSGSGITSLTANGGWGGQASITPNATVPGGQGGTAYGEASDMTVTGGPGGLVTLGSSNCVGAAAGGAVGLRGIQCNGGNAHATVAGAAAAGGGAGVGGRGGNATANSADSNAAASGGGCAGPAADTTNAIGTASQAGYNHRGVNGGGPNPLQNSELDSATGGGGIAGITSVPADAPYGGGSGGCIGGTGDYGATLFGGSGGRAIRGFQGTINASEGGQCGGAPGGVAGISGPNAGLGLTCQGRPGRSGLVVIEF